MTDLDAFARRSRMVSVVLGVCCVAVLAWRLLAPAPTPAPTPAPAPAPDAFRAYVAQLRADGVPTTPGELCGPEPSADVNSAPEIGAALRSLEEWAGPESAWRVTGPWEATPADDDVPWYERASQGQLGDLEDFLVRIRPFFDRVAAAADRPRCWFPFDVDRMGVTKSVGIPSMQRLTRVFVARAFAARDPGERIEACRTLVALSWRFEPVESTGYMVKAAMASAAVTALRRGVETGEIDAASVRARLDPLLAPTSLDLHSRYFAAELVSDIAGFEAKLDGRDPPSPGHDYSPEAPTIFAGWCEVHRDAAKWPTQPYPDYLRRARKAIETGRREDQGMTMLLPSVAAKLGQVEARCRLARIALAAAEHRATHGEFPASLDELKPMFPDGVPLDPFTDAPFVYGKTADGVRIASAGRLAEDPPLDEATLRERVLVWELKR